MQAGRLLRTARHLKPVQVYGRVLFRVTRPRVQLHGAPPRRELAGSPGFLIWREPSLLGPGSVRLLNEAGEVATPSDWNAPERAKLWLYNLHYFDDLTARGWRDRQAWHEAMVGRWIAENPPGTGNGWEPYPTSLRIVNWIKWALSGGVLSPEAQASLAVQLRWLEGRLERHLLGNHLLANAKALVFGGAFFAGREAERWLEMGRNILSRELKEQVLSDGAHFERSPMYHAILLEDVLDLLVMLARAGVDGDLAGELRAVVPAMLEWLAGMTHPDGGIAFFNDAAFGIAAPTADLVRHAQSLGSAAPDPTKDGLRWFAPSGYARLSLGEAVALVDAAPVGPDYLPGHAHADTLSFEFSLGKERVIVNRGTSTYGTGPLRLEERGTAAHSTVGVDGENSSEVWSGFRVGRRARVFDVEASEASGAAEIAGAHDGYRHLPGKPVHRRRWRLTPDALTVEDRVDGPYRRAVARFHLAPGVTPNIDPDGRSGTLTTRQGRAIRWRTNASALVEPSVWSCEFGRREPTQALAAPVGPEGLRTELGW